MRFACLLPLIPVMVSCAGDRVARTEADIQILRSDIADLRANVEMMTIVLERNQRHVSTEQMDRSPEGFDPKKPLPKGSAQKPDVILLSIDTLRADHLGAYGYERDTSPFFDELAAGGTRFADTWAAAPWTLPSHATMLSGLLPPNHGAIEDHLEIGKIPMMQEAFSFAGYGTAGVVSTLFVSKRYGFDRGFDHFEDFEIEGAAMNNASTVDAEHVFNNALHWAQGQEDGKPLFLFLHVYDVHFGYNAPPPHNEQFDRAAQLGDPIYREYGFYKQNPLTPDELQHEIDQYDEEIAYVDARFRDLIEGWRASGRDVVVAVTADHGEEFGERGSWGHAHTLHREQLHVPWIVNGKGVRKQVVTDRVGSEDIASTLAGLAGVPFPAADGVNRAAQARNGSRPPQNNTSGRFAETSRFQTLRYRWHSDGQDMIVDVANAKRGLCNVDDDTWCKKNLYTKKGTPERGDAMFAEMMEYLGDAWEASEPGRIDVKDGVIFSGVERHRQQLEVELGDRFSVHPADAYVMFTSVEGTQHGPYRALGGDLPDDEAPVSYDGTVVENTTIDLTDDEREMLEKLGYLQEGG